MKTNFVVLPILAAGFSLSALAQGTANPPANTPPKAPATASNTAPGAGTATPVKIGLINARDAILATADGKKAALDLEEKFSARRTNLQKHNIDLQTKEDNLKRNGATMSEAARGSAARDLESDKKSFQRDVEDLNTDAEEEQNKLVGTIWTKMQPILQQYALQNGYAAILDVGNEQSPVLWASNTSFITEEIVNLYNQAHPSTSTPSAPKAPASATPGAAKPPTPPPGKKQ